MMIETPLASLPVGFFIVIKQIGSFHMFAPFQSIAALLSRKEWQCIKSFGKMTKDSSSMRRLFCEGK